VRSTWRFLLPSKKRVVITFNNTTLADPGAAPPRYAILEDLGGEALIQKEPLYNAPFPALFPRGNTNGQCVFTVAASYGSIAAAVIAFSTAYSLVGSQGTLTLLGQTGSAGMFTMPTAILRSAKRTKWQTLFLEIRYTFEITQITAGVTADSATVKADTTTVTADSL
jgi:hypothetical protein